MVRLFSVLLVSIVIAVTPSHRVLAGAAGASADRANSYDDGWQTSWVEHGRNLLEASEAKRSGFILHIGDSITHARPYSQWAVNGLGRTAADRQLIDWSQPTAWGATDPDGTVKNGWFLAGLDVTGRRSMTAASGLTLREFVSGHGNGDRPMPAVTDPALARKVIADPAYDGDLQVDTVCAAFGDAQVAVVMLGTNEPADADNIANLNAVLDRLEARNILPVLSTVPPQQDPLLGEAVVRLNAAIASLAESRALPLIDLYQEVILRRPGGSWYTTLISPDGVHPTAVAPGFDSASDPYLPGGDPAVHTTGDAALNVGYLLRSWLTVQKLKEVKSEVIDRLGVPPPAPPAISSPASATATAGRPFSYQIIAGNNPTSFDAAPLPSGLSVNTTTGLVAGTPAAAGSFSVTLLATNAVGSATLNLQLTVGPPVAVPAISSPLKSSAVVGAAFTYQITASNSPASYGASGLPKGLSVTPATGVITGTPNTAGTSKVTINATNSAGTGTATLVLTIGKKPR